jgi:hypothetical protein
LVFVTGGLDEGAEILNVGEEQGAPASAGGGRAGKVGGGCRLLLYVVRFAVPDGVIEIA